MTRLLFGLVIVALWGSVSVQRTPFADVSPCHWATESLAGIAGTPEVDVEQARTSTYLAENALRQVLEGLKCGDLGWSAGFMSGTPEGTVSNGELQSYTLAVASVTLAGDSGSLDYSLTAVIDGGEVVRAGIAELVFAGKRWRVRYDSLAALGLPLFP